MKGAEPLHLQCPVTALHFIGPLLVAAQGNDLLLINNATGTTTYSEKIIPGQAIHGVISVSSHNECLYCFVWGGRYGRFVCIENENETRPIAKVCSSLYVSQDWILSAAFRRDLVPAKNAGIGSLAMITGHNGLVLLRMSHDYTKSILFSEIELSKATRTLLYCGHVSWISDTQILLAAGTALGEVIVWSYFVGHSTTTNDLQTHRSATLYSFDAHDGSVFGLDLLIFKGKFDEICHVILCSCSDDRSIRLWDITSRFDTVQRRTTAHLEHSMDSFLAETTHSKLLPPLLCKTWAHTSRIWHVMFMPQRKSDADLGSGMLLSFGEDATLQKWKVQFDNAKRINLKHLGSVCAHSGKNLWAYAIDLKSEGSYRIATGGADGAIILTDLDRIGIHVDEDSFIKYQASQKPTLNSIMSPGDKIKTYSFLNSRKLLVTTHIGRILVGSIQECSTNKTPESDLVLLEDLGTFTDLVSYSIVESLTEMDAAFIASSRGDVYCYHPDGTFEKILVVEGKITGLFTVISTLSPPDRVTQGAKAVPFRSCYLLIAQLGYPKMTLLEFQLIRDRLHHGSRINLDSAHDSPVTSLSCLYHGSCITLLVGFRSGHMSIYTLPDQLPIPEALPMSIQALNLFHCHNDGITSMLTKCSGNRPDRPHVLTTGRDSQFAVHEVTFGKKATLRTVHKATIPLGPFIEGAFVRARDQHLLFYGFKSTDFVIFDESEQQVISSVNCGGAHRVWAYQHASREEAGSFAGNFVWTRSGLLNSLCVSGEGSQVLRRGTHGREIKSCASCAFYHDRASSASSVLIASAAEDTDIRVFECQTANTTLSVNSVGIIRKHNTGVQRLHFSHGGQYLFSCGSSEEFYIWKLSRVPFISVGIVCEAILPPISELPDLRIMDFQVLELKGSYADEPIQDYPTFQISMIFSDSTIRVYNYSKSAGFQLLGIGSYGTSCLTQVACLHPFQWININDGNDIHPKITMTGGTDGHIMLWQRPEPFQDRKALNEPCAFQVCFRHKVHQNTIKCMENIAIPLQYQAADTYIVVTGGDDNAIAVTRLDLLRGEEQIRQCHSSESPEGLNTIAGLSFDASSVMVLRAHAASVCSLKIFASDRKNQTFRWEIVTTGNDQRVKTWTLSVDLNKKGADSIQVSKSSTRFTAVADVGDTCLLPTGAKDLNKHSLVVCGVGMEICSLP